MWDLAEQVEKSYGYPAAQRFYDIVAGKQTPILSLVEKFLASNSDVPPKTDYTRRLAFHKFQDVFPDAAFETFSKADAVTYVDQLASLHPVTANTRLWPLSSLWKFAVKRQICSDNVWTGLGFQTKRKGESKRPFTDTEVRHLLTKSDELVDPMISDLWRFLFLTGCRISEICNMKVASIEDNFIRIESGKTPSARRRIWVSQQLAPIIDRRLNGAYLFDEIAKPPKDRCRSVYPSKVLNRFRKAKGIDEKDPGQRQSNVDVHSARRWWATKAFRAGISREVVEACMGHSSKSLAISVYSAGFSDGQIRSCFEAVKLP